MVWNMCFPYIEKNHPNWLSMTWWYQQYDDWLVVWNITLFFHILGMSSSQLPFIFFRGIEATNQISAIQIISRWFSDNAHRSQSIGIAVWVYTWSIDLCMSTWLVVLFIYVSFPVQQMTWWSQWLYDTGWNHRFGCLNTQIGWLSHNCSW